MKAPCNQLDVIMTMAAYSAEMLWFELRLAFSLFVLFQIARLWGLDEYCLRELTTRLIEARVKLPVRVGRVDLRLSLLSGSGEVELEDLRFFQSGTTEQEIVHVKKVFISFYTIDSLVAVVSSGGTQLVVDNVCLESLRVNVEMVDVEVGDEDDHPGSAVGQRGLKKLLNIWLIANAINNPDGPYAPLDDDDDDDVDGDDDHREEETELASETWRETLGDLTNRRRTSRAMTVSPSVLRAYPSVSAGAGAGAGAATTPPLSLSRATTTTTTTTENRVPTSPLDLFQQFNDSALGLFRRAQSGELQRQLERDANEFRCGVLQRVGKIERDVNDSAQSLLRQVQSGELQRQLSQQVERLERDASEFRDDVIAEGLVSATSRRVRSTLTRARNTLDEELSRSLPATIAELHAKVVGPDCPEWTRDVLRLCRVWIGGCLLVTDVDVKFRGILPPLVEAALENRALRIPGAVVMDGVGHAEPVPEGGNEGTRQVSGGLSPGTAARRRPRLEEGWALPLLQRRLEIALVVQATRQNLLSAVDDVRAVLS